jgi:hypothetical protein
MNLLIPTITLQERNLLLMTKIESDGTFLYSFALLIFSAIGSFFYRMQLPWKKHLHLNYIQPFSSTLFFNFSRKLRRGLPYWSYWDEYRLLDIAVLYCCRTPMLQPHQRRNKGSYLEDFLYL